MSLGILAYGSLVASPAGDRIGDCRTHPEREDAVQSGICPKEKDPGICPDLDPGRNGGAQIDAEILVIRGDITPDAAADMLWRRETHQTGRQKYRRPDVIGRDDVVVETIHDLSGVRIVLYTKIGQNIDRLSATDAGRTGHP